MEIVVRLDDKGNLPARFGKYADEAEKVVGHVVRSFPFEVTGVPEGAKTLALVMRDYDSIPVCGFAWIHWLAANIPAAPDVSVAEDASRTGVAGMVQGANSNCSRFLPPQPAEVTVGYTGPNPPDTTHDYTFTVYALDCALGLPDGFYGNALRRAMAGHVLDEATVELPYPA